VLTYADAIKRLTVAGKRTPSRKTIARAIDQLIKYGFIDITHAGGGIRGDYSLYAISQRWREYGEEGFIVKTRQKDTRFGFTKENWEERTRRKRKEESTLGVKNDTGLSVKNDTGHVNSAASLRPIEKGNIDVNHFIQKGELVLKAFRSPKWNQCQKGHHSIVFHSSPEHLAEALPTND
jgi:DNA-binding PadR family transcriptional regulator